MDGGDADEWVSEGVQVGGVTSAMGVLGIWTGAYHERMDPIGKFLHGIRALMARVTVTIPSVSKFRSLVGVEGGLKGIAA